ncbi:MAG: hypothetical protein SFX19_04015 [Alphaproteobacteria bacterium]|nr:hypothetical protein [Alphaproteobacteria bacterium]
MANRDDKTVVINFKGAVVNIAVDTVMVPRPRTSDSNFGTRIDMKIDSVGDTVNTFLPASKLKVANARSAEIAELIKKEFVDRGFDTVQDVYGGKLRLSTVIPGAVPGVPHAEAVVKSEGFYTRLCKMAEDGRLGDKPEIPENWEEILKAAKDRFVFSRISELYRGEKKLRPAFFQALIQTGDADAASEMAASINHAIVTHQVPGAVARTRGAEVFVDVVDESKLVKLMGALGMEYETYGEWPPHESMPSYDRLADQALMDAASRASGPLPG